MHLFLPGDTRDHHKSRRKGTRK